MNKGITNCFGFCLGKAYGFVKGVSTTVVVYIIAKTTINIIKDFTKDDSDDRS